MLAMATAVASVLPRCCSAAARIHPQSLLRDLYRERIYLSDLVLQVTADDLFMIIVQGLHLDTELISTCLLLRGVQHALR